MNIFHGVGWVSYREVLLLYQMDVQGGGFRDVGLTATRNSNGYAIRHVEGREYSMCN